MAEVPNACAKIKVENTEPDDTLFRQENAERPEYPVSYSPIPKGTVKEEPESEEDGDECQLIAYSPLPPDVIKEEPELEDDHDDSSNKVQVISLVV